MTPSATQPNNFIAGLLATNKMTLAAVIDDAFDPIQDDEITEDQIREFHQNNDADETFDELLIKLNITKPDDDELQDKKRRTAYLNDLWKARTGSPQLREMLGSLLQVRLQKDLDLTLICENLTKLGIKVSCFGSDVTAEDLVTGEERFFDFVFIDYFLGTDDSQEAIRLAEEKIREVHTCCTTARKPVTVLMSSSPDAAKHKDGFRKNAELVEGVFRFSAKSELKDEHILSLVVGALAKEFAHSHEIQAYVTALCSAAENALVRFREDVRSLSVEDYVFIQNLGLEKDEQPLGDYVTWLYSSYWEQSLMRDQNLQMQQKKLNSVFQSNYPILHGQPSPKLADVYMSTIFEEHTDLVNNARVIAQAKKAFEAAESLENQEIVQSHLNASLVLSLGDVFEKSAADPVWMVINAQCDLARAYKVPTQSVLLVPGKLTPWSAVFERDEEVVRTEFFRIDNNAYRIVWDVKSVMSLPFNQVWSWKRKEGYSRRLRLKLPFALDVQRAFATKLTRIGLPVPPPLTSAVNIEVYHRIKRGTPYLVVPTSTAYASQVGIRGPYNAIESKLLFTLPFAQQLGAAVRDLATTLGPGFTPTATQLKHPMVSLAENFEEWFFTLAGKPQALPKSGKSLPLGENVLLTLDWDWSTQLDWNKTSLIINVLSSGK
ncbi:hypothetical protein GCM10027048_32650 [Hymenobacter coalescens]